MLSMKKYIRKMQDRRSRKQERKEQKKNDKERQRCAQEKEAGNRKTRKFLLKPKKARNANESHGSAPLSPSTNHESAMVEKKGEDNINPDIFVEDKGGVEELVITNLCQITGMPRTEFAQKTPTGVNKEGGFFRSLNFLKHKEKRRGKKTHVIGVFGTPLTEGSIAQINKLIAYLSKNLDAEDLFCSSGSSKNQNSLKALLNTGADADLESEVDPHDVATLLKTFLKELPEHLLTHRHFNTHMKIVDMTLIDEQGNKSSIPDKELQIEALQLLFLLLPQANRSLLKLLLDLLYHTAMQQDKNKMSEKTLACIFAPLFFPKYVTTGAREEEKMNNIIAFLIEHSQKLFRAPVSVQEIARIPLAGTKTLQTKDELELLAVGQEEERSVMSVSPGSAEAKKAEKPTADPTPTVTPPTTPVLDEFTTCSEQEVPAVKVETAAADRPEPSVEIPVFKDESAVAASPESLLKPTAVQLKEDLTSVTGPSPDALQEQAHCLEVEVVECESVANSPEPLVEPVLDSIFPRVHELKKIFEQENPRESDKLAKFSCQSVPNPNKSVFYKPTHSEPGVPVVEDKSREAAIPEPSADSERAEKPAVMHLKEEPTPLSGPITAAFYERTPLLEPVDKEESVAVTSVDPAVEFEKVAKPAAVQLKPDLTSVTAASADASYEMTSCSESGVQVVEDNSVVASSPEPLAEAEEELERAVMEPKFQSVVNLVKIFEQEDPSERENMVKPKCQSVSNLKMFVEPSVFYEQTPYSKSGVLVVKDKCAAAASHEPSVESEEAGKPTAVQLKTYPTPVIDPIDAAFHKQTPCSEPGDQEAAASSEPLVKPAALSLLSEPGALVVEIESAAAVISPEPLAKEKMVLAVVEPKCTLIRKLKTIFEQDLPREREVDQLKCQSVSNLKMSIEQSSSIVYEQTPCSEPAVPAFPAVKDEYLVATCLELSSGSEKVAKPANMQATAYPKPVTTPITAFYEQTPCSDQGVPVVEEVSAAANSPGTSAGEMAKTAAVQLKSDTTPVSGTIAAAFHEQTTPCSQPGDPAVKDVHEEEPSPVPSAESEKVQLEADPTTASIAAALYKQTPCSEPVVPVVEDNYAAADIPESSAETGKVAKPANMQLRADPTPIDAAAFYTPPWSEPDVTVVENDSAVALSPEPSEEVEPAHVEAPLEQVPVVEDESTASASPEPSAEVVKAATPAAMLLKSDSTPVTAPIAATLYEPTPCSEPAEEDESVVAGSSPEPPAESGKATKPASVQLTADPCPVPTPIVAAFYTPTPWSEPDVTAVKNESPAAISPEPLVEAEEEVDPVVVQPKCKFQQLRQIYEQEDPRESENTNELVVESANAAKTANVQQTTDLNPVQIPSYEPTPSSEPWESAVDTSPAQEVIKLKKLFEEDNRDPEKVAKLTHFVSVPNLKTFYETLGSEPGVPTIENDCACPEPSVGSHKATEPVNVQLTADFNPAITPIATALCEPTPCSEPGVSAVENESAVKADPTPVTTAPTPAAFANSTPWSEPEAPAVKDENVAAARSELLAEEEAEPAVVELKCQSVLKLRKFFEQEQEDARESEKMATLKCQSIPKLKKYYETPCSEPEVQAVEDKSVADGSDEPVVLSERPVKPTFGHNVQLRSEPTPITTPSADAFCEQTPWSEAGFTAVENESTASTSPESLAEAEDELEPAVILPKCRSVLNLKKFFEHEDPRETERVAKLKCQSLPKLKKFCEQSACYEQTPC